MDTKFQKQIKKKQSSKGNDIDIKKRMIRHTGM